MADPERIARMRKVMVAERLDVLVLRMPENVLLLSGFWPMIGATVLVFPLDGTPMCVVPACFEPEAAEALREVAVTYCPYGVLCGPDPASELKRIIGGMAKQARWKRIGYEDNVDRIAAPWNSAETLINIAQTRNLLTTIFEGRELVDVWPLLQLQRSRKTDYETAKLRIVNAISAIGLKAFARSVQAGVSGVELVAEVEREIMVLGSGFQDACRVRGYAQVATGPAESAVAHRPSEVSTRRVMQSGDIAVLELAVVADGYWADRTRVRVAGQPSDEQVKIFELVRAAQEAALAALRPGAAGAEIDEAARSIIREAGYADSFPHITGHGVGFCYHESIPQLAPGVTERLNQGMLTSIEPGIYLNSCGGIRIEDNVLVTESGAETLGAFPKEIA